MLGEWAYNGGVDAVMTTRPPPLDRPMPADPLALLTKAERETLLSCPAHECNQGKVAKALGIPVGTVQWRLAKVYTKFGVSCLFEALVKAGVVVVVEREESR